MMSQILLRVLFCERALLALIAAHDDPEKLGASLDRAFETALSPDAPEQFVVEKQKFVARLKEKLGGNDV